MILKGETETHYLFRPLDTFNIKDYAVFYRRFRSDP